MQTKCGVRPPRGLNSSTTTSAPLPSYHPPKAEDAQSLSLRYIYSYFSLFGDPLMNPALDPYPDGLLQRLSTLEINGVWLHVLLRDMAPGGTAFPEFGEGHESPAGHPAIARQSGQEMRHRRVPVHG